MTALCCEPYCDLPGGKVSVRLFAPDASYTGRAYNRTNVEGLDAWNSAGAGGLVISYEGLAETPVIPGKYTAQLAPVSESSEKAKAKFEITRIDYPGDMDTWSELYNEEGFTTIVELPVLPTGGKYRMDQIKLPANLTGKEKSPTQLAVYVTNKIDPEESIQVQIPVQSMECYNDFVMTLTLYPVSHEHKWEYYNLEGDDAVLVAICTAERCTIPIQQGYHAVGVRVTAADKIYDGRPYEMSGIALENEEQWRAYGAGGINISLADAKAPVYPGTYTVNASPANDTSVIAYTTFTIKNSDWRGDTDFYGELFNVEGHTSEIYLPPLPVDGSYDIANMSGVPEGVTAQINKDGQLLLMAKRQLVNVDSFTVVIPVNTSRDFNSYTIKVHINVIDHEHKWKYNAEGNKLIAECVNPMFCSIPTTADGKHAIAVLLLAEDMQYNGQAYPKSNITLSGYEQWNSYAGIAPIIVDFTNGKAPVDVGEYTATATTGSGDNIATARANFNILPGAIVDITNVSGNALHARIQDSPAISALSPILVDEDHKTGAEIELVATELFDISKAEKELARSCMRTGEKVAAFVDLSMYKIVLGDEMKMSVLPNGAVTIAAEMPYPIRSRIKKLEVIGIHKGKVARLGAAYNKETGTVSFKTDRFSTYVFVYTQSKLPDTGDHANPEQWGIIALLTMIGIIILMRGRKQLG